jgi:hypothetical protein
MRWGLRTGTTAACGACADTGRSTALVGAGAPPLCTSSSNLMEPAPPCAPTLLIGASSYLPVAVSEVA